MNNVIIVSKCCRVIKINSKERWFEFHFKGVFAGVELKKISLSAKMDVELIEGEEYIIYMRVIRVEDSTLIGTILKTKRLEDCWDRS